MSDDPHGAPARVCSVVLGLGSTGMSCARYLHAQGHRVVVMDSRARPPHAQRLRAQYPDITLITGGFHVEYIAGADQLVLSPGVATDEPVVTAARAAGIPVRGDIDLFVEEVGEAAERALIAITGSNGKSTVTTLVARMLEAAGRRALAGGNLGQPALDLLHAREPNDVWVLELSSFQLESTPCMRSAAAVVLNLSADHLDRHGSMAAYAAAKGAIYRETRLAVVNRDDPRAAALAGDAERVVSFGLERPGPNDYGLVRHAGEDWLARGDRRLLRAVEIAMIGRHNVANALAALALACAIEPQVEPALEVLRRFAGLAHRAEVVATVDGVRYVNDSKATNVGAAQAAIAGVEGGVVLIAGGQGKGADFAALAGALRGRGRAAILIGEDAPLLAAALDGVCPLHAAASMDDAVRIAASLATPGDTVLLSPACASFDMFTGFEARGDAFRAAVLERTA